MNKYHKILYKKFYLKFLFQKERYHLFTYLAQGLKNGGTIRELLESISYEYKKSKKYFLSEIIDNVLDLMEQEGMSDSNAMYEAGLISYLELQSIETISKAEPYRAMQFINEKTKNNDNLKWAIGMLIFPPLLIIVGYFIFQPELKEMTLGMLEPINSMSSKQIAVPDYLESRTFFGTLLIMSIAFISGIFYFINYLKTSNQKLLFKLFRIKEREFVLNTFEVLLGLLRSGQSQMRAVELLSENSDVVSNKIFADIAIAIREGDKTMYEVFSEYGMDSATISYIRSGEMNNYLIESIEMALEYNKERYDKLSKLLQKIMPLSGEIIMTIILLKPLLDIITITTVGSLSFEL